MAVQDEGPKIMVVIWVVISVSLIVILLRSYCKFSISRRLGLDDGIVILAWILLFIYTVLITFAVKHGLGKHLVDLMVAPPPADVPLAMKYVLIGEVIAIVGCSLSKTSFAFTLLRIVVAKWQTGFLWSIIISLSLVMGVCAILYLVMCNPIAKSWNTAVPGKCWPVEVANDFAMFAGIYSGLVDFMLAVFPWTIIWNLQMKTRDKIGVGLALSLGIFASVSAFIKTSYLPNLNNVSDITYYSSDLLIWAASETGVTIVAVSLPSLRTLFPGLKSSRNYSSGQTEGYRSYQLRNREGSSGAKLSVGTDVFSGTHRNSRGMLSKNRNDDSSSKSILGKDAADVEAGIGLARDTKDGYIKKTNEITVTYEESNGIHSDE